MISYITYEFKRFQNVRRTSTKQNIEALDYHNNMPLIMKVSIASVQTKSTYLYWSGIIYDEEYNSNDCNEDSFYSSNHARET